MGIFKKILKRVMSDGFSDCATEEETLYEETGTAVINTKELFKDGYAFCNDDNLFDEVEDINDNDYWWCFKGHENFEADQNELPFDQETLDAAIDHLNQKIEAGDIPVFTVPNHIMQVMQLLGNDDFDYGEVAALVEKNPALAGMFISSINSSFYNRGIAINDLRSALLRLGKNNIRALLQLYSIKVSFADDKRFGAIASNIIVHSYTVAIVASYLSQRYFPDPGLAFLAGLLHDVGKLGILKELSQSPQFCLNMKSDIKESMFTKIFEGRHEQVGGQLGKQWNMDAISIAAIERHHNFWEYDFSEEDQLDYQLCQLINLSDTIARILGRGRLIGPRNLFREPATIDLNLEKNASTIDFLNDIPEIVEFKSANQIF